MDMPVKKELSVVVVGGVGFKKWENMCRLNCVGVEKSEYINVGVKKWLKKTAFRCKKVEAKKGYHIYIFADMFTKVHYFITIFLGNISAKYINEKP